MRKVTALITTLALILLATPSLAKGPISATIMGPGIDEPIELIDGQSHDEAANGHIRTLMAQTGLWFTTPSLQRIDPPGELGRPLTLTWVNMGPPNRIEEERTIRQEIYLHAEGGPVIHNPDHQYALEGWGGEPTGWFRAPTELIETLRALGVPTEADVTPAVPSSVVLLCALALSMVAAFRLVNSRLRPVVSSQ